MTTSADGTFETRLHAFLARSVPGYQATLAWRRLSGGASQETYRLDVRTTTGDRRLALRRTADGAPVVRTSGQAGLGNEAVLLRLAHAGGVPVPEILATLAPTDELGEGFLMPWLSGETLGHRIVRDPALAALTPSLAYRCGQALARIHALEIPDDALATPLEDSPPRVLVERTWRNYQALGTPQPMIDYTARWLLDHLPTAPRHTLVHGDFRNGNLMVDGTGIVAVLDWELTHRGDPMRDLGWLCTPSWRFGRGDVPVGGFGSYADLFAGYRAESGLTVDAEAVRFWEIFGAFWWAVGCLLMADQYRHGPDRSVERPAIGRRSSECQVDCVNYLIPGPCAQVPGDGGPDTALPGIDELLASVRDFLRQELTGHPTERVQYLAKVAANSLEIVRRDQQYGAAARAAEATRLRHLLAAPASLSLPALRWTLVERLRAGDFSLDNPGLTEHLRETVVNEVLIDQPGYAGALRATSA